MIFMHKQITRIENQLTKVRKNDKVLLHSCCVVCSAAIMEQLKIRGIPFAVFFCNPNIFPAAEYKKRRDEQAEWCRTNHVAFIDDKYDTLQYDWENDVALYGLGPEGGKRCYACFLMRMRKSAQAAVKHGYEYFATTLGISRYKNLELVNQAGKVAESETDGTAFLAVNWRKKGGSQRMHEIARKNTFYRQKYCGCRFSLPQV